MFSRETPAGFARLLYMQVKAVRDDLKACGYDLEHIYFAIVSALVRLAMEDGAVAQVRELAARILEETDRAEEVPVVKGTEVREMLH